MLNLKERIMATTEEQAAFVARCVDPFADAEKACAGARHAIAVLVPLIKEGQQLGLAGSLQANRMACDLRSAAGFVSRAESIVFSIHGEGTTLAQDKGVDVPQPRDGGGHR